MKGVSRLRNITIKVYIMELWRSLVKKEMGWECMFTRRETSTSDCGSKILSFKAPICLKMGRALLEPSNPRVESMVLEHISMQMGIFTKGSGETISNVDKEL